MRMLAIVALATLSLGSVTPSTSQAAPVAGLTTIEISDYVEQIKKGGHKFKKDKGWKGSQYDRGYGSGRYNGGPPPHARAYGRRARDFGYYRY